MDVVALDTTTMLQTTQQLSPSLREDAATDQPAQSVFPAATAAREEPGDDPVAKAQAEAEALEQARELKHQQGISYLQLYIQTLGAPEEKLDQEAAAEAAKNETEEDEEEELKKMRRGAKDAVIVEDPQEPGQVKIMVRSYDKEGKPHFTRTHNVDSGGGQDEDKRDSSRETTDKSAGAYDPDKQARQRREDTVDTFI